MSIPHIPMKNNVYQNFYIIGYDPNDLFKIPEGSSLTNLSIFNNGLKIRDKNIIQPKILSKFPPKNSEFNSISDEIVLINCMNIEKKRITNNIFVNKPSFLFNFELDNFPFYHRENDSFIYKKLYFNCILFTEDVREYYGLLKEITNFMVLPEEQEKKKLYNEEIKKMNSSNKLPKIFCLASLYPLIYESKKLLFGLLDYYKNNPNNNLISIEKYVEQIIFSIPLPYSFTYDYMIDLSKIMMSYKAKEYNKVIINKAPMQLSYLNINYTYEPLLFLYMFEIETLVKLYKHILLGTPILIFNKDDYSLSTVILNLISILSPFEYAYPYTTRLPKEFYGLINSETNFIFGINEYYTENFLKDIGFEFDKNMIIVDLNKDKCDKLIEIERKFLNDRKVIVMTMDNKYVDLRETKSKDISNIDFPSNYKKKLISKLNSIMKEMKEKILKKKEKLIIKDMKYVYGSKIREVFFQFLASLLQGYTLYIKKNSLKEMTGYNILFKLTENNSTFFSDFLVEELFYIEDFIYQFNKETQNFYRAFINSKIFVDYLRKRFFNKNMNYKEKYTNYIFDIYTMELKGEIKLKDDVKTNKINENAKNVDKVVNIKFSRKYDFTYDEANSILSKSSLYILKNYNQLILNNKPSNSQIKIKYFLIPKLIYDNNILTNDFREQFYMHMITLPNGKNCQEYLENYINKIEDTKKKYEKILSNYIKDNNNLNKNHRKSSVLDENYRNYLGKKIYFNFEFLNNWTIEFCWLILCCCSLWYCEEIEKDIRINKIFEIMERLEYIDEQVLDFVFYAIIKYGSKCQTVRIYEMKLAYKMSVSYTDISIFYMKMHGDSPDNYNEYYKRFISNESNITEKSGLTDNNIEQNEETKYTVKTRSLIFNLLQSPEEESVSLPFNKLDSNLISNIESDNIYKEEILFNTVQLCIFCNESNEIDIFSSINKPLFNENSNNMNDNIINDNDNNFEYVREKCKKCGNYFTIKVDYNINLKKKSDKNFIKTLKNGSFQLMSPYQLFKKIKNYVLSLEEQKLDIKNLIFDNDIPLFNLIFYFSLKNLHFDFLFPYSKKIYDIEKYIKNLEEYYNNYDYDIEYEKRFDMKKLKTNNEENFKINKTT